MCRFRSSYPLGGLAEFERHLIVARTSEGRKRAQANDVLFGRPSDYRLVDRIQAEEVALRAHLRGVSRDLERRRAAEVVSSVVFQAASRRSAVRP